MGNFLKETVAKVAGNVTQSVTSAVIVTLITTYVLVNPGKKDSTGPVSNGDSLKINPARQSMQLDENTSSGIERKANQDRPTLESKPFLTNGKQKSNGRVTPGDEGSPTQGKEEVKTAEEKRPRIPKLETSLAASKTKTDSVAKEKQIPKDVKQVQKRAADVFDELDEEAAKKPPR